LNICLFTTTFLPDIGGMEIVLDKLARYFQSRGHNPVVISQRSRHNPRMPHLPYECIHYPRPRSAVWLLQYVKYVLLREHKKHHFDIIHAHMAYPTGYIAVKLREKLGVPVIITSHKGDIIPQSRYRRRFITRRRMCWAMEKADAITGVSSELKDIIDNLTSNKAISLVIPNGVDIPDDTPGSVPESCAAIVGKPFMLTLGRLHHYKGLDILLEAIKQLSAQSVQVPKLVIAGEGREMQNLKKLVVDLDLENKVIFAGVVFGEHKQWLLRNCRFFIQPSRTEGMPLTVLEAMSYGKVVIGTKISGTIELITHNENGFLVEPENSVSLSQAILALLESKNIDSIQHRAREFASQMTWPVIAEQYLDLYKKLLH